MNGLELKECLQKFPNLNRHFKGIYFIDKLPSNLKKFSFIICNTDFFNGIGKHWIVFVRLDRHIECFDSLGIDNVKKELIVKFAHFKNCSEILYNETQYQSQQSNSCGKFVLYYILERFFNLDLDFEDLLSESFDSSIEVNENKVLQFYSENFDN